MGPLAEAYILIRADSSQLPSDIAGARSQMESGLSNTASGIAGTVSGVVGGVMSQISNMVSVAGGNLISNLIGSIGSYGQQAASFFQGASAEVEGYRLSLGVLLKDQDRADAMLADVRKMAAETPFETGDLLRSVQLLKQYGFESQKLLPMMRTIGDAASASPDKMGDAVHRISLAIGQMKASGKLMGGEILQLVNAGVPAQKILEKAYGKSLEDIKKLTKSGKIGIDDVIKELMKGLDDRFGGMMEKKAKTFDGLMSTLKDNMKEFAASAGGPLNEFLKKNLETIVGWFKTDHATKFMEFVKTSLQTALDFTQQIIDRTLDWFNSDEPAKYWGAVVEWAYKAWDVIKSVAATQTAWARFLWDTSPWKMLIGFLDRISGTGAGTALAGQLGGLSTTIQEITSNWSGFIVDGLAEAKQGFDFVVAGARDLLKTILGIKDDAALDEFFASLISPALEFVNKLTEGWAVFTSDFGNTWEVMKTGTAAGVSYVGDLFNNLWLNIKNGFLALWESLTATLGAVVKNWAKLLDHPMLKMQAAAAASSAFVTTLASTGSPQKASEAAAAAAVNVLGPSEALGMLSTGLDIGKAGHDAWANRMNGTPGLLDSSLGTKNLTLDALNAVGKMTKDRESKRAGFLDPDAMAAALADPLAGGLEDAVAAEVEKNQFGDEPEDPAIRAKQKGKKGGSFFSLVDFAKDIQNSLLRSDPGLEVQKQVKKEVEEVKKNGKIQIDLNQKQLDAMNKIMFPSP